MIRSANKFDIPTFRIPKIIQIRQGPDSGRLLIKFKRDAITPSTSEGNWRISGRNPAKLPEAVSKILDYLRNNHGLQRAIPILSDRYRTFVKTKQFVDHYQGLGIISSVVDAIQDELAGISLFQLETSTVSAGLLKKLNSTPEINYAEQLPVRFLSGARATADPNANRQWGLRAIQWFGASIPDSSRIHIGVLDSGIDERHTELAGVIEKYYCGGQSKEDIVGHGTHVAGIIRATTNNRAGITGTTMSRLSMWKIFGDKPDPIFEEFVTDGTAYLQSLGQALRDSVDVLNLSLGGTAISRTEKSIIDALVKSGTIVVAAMGNEYLDGNPIEYPAAYSDVIAVGSINEAGRRSPFSNTGPHIDIVAPGSNILSTLPQRSNVHRDECEYAAWSGTSMATGYVSAAAALLKAKSPGIKPDAARDLLTRSASKLGEMKRRAWTEQLGHGLLNVNRALK